MRFLLLLLLLSALLPSTNAETVGIDAFREGKKTTTHLSDSADAFWRSILTWREGAGYTIEDAYRGFMQTFVDRGIAEQGPLFIAKAYLDRKEATQGVHYLHESIKVKDNAEAFLLLAEHDVGAGERLRQERLSRAFELSAGDPALNVRMGHAFFAKKELNLALLCFDRAFQSNSSNVDAFTNAVYIRTNIAAWGDDGSRFQKDMQGLESVIRKEMVTSMLRENDVEQQSVIHPHMTLAYPLPPELKLAVAKSHAGAELNLVRKAGIVPLDHRKMLPKYKSEFKDSEARIRVGYVSCSLKSKALVYLTQNLMGFHDRSRFEVHAYATTPPDDPIFLEKAMYGVDWRQKIKASVEYFHETAGLDVLQLSKLIQSHGIHILVDWDGYSHNGIRPTGLFPMQSAPLQVVHQEYIGTMGAPYFQYQVSDITASPIEMWPFHSEKFVIMPHTFFVNSFAYQTPHLEPSPLKLPSKRSPGKNGCGGAPATFVYCNFNKHLKFDPDMFRAWLQVLQDTNDSVLCLLEFPAEGKPNLVNFIKNVNRKLASRVRFQPFMNNPYENQRRVVDMCHAVLDTPIYNGHTTSMEALYGGVPVLTSSVRKDMSALVGTSALTTLEIPELIASSTKEYRQIAVRLGSDTPFYQQVRNRLIATTNCSKSSPLNPLWDLQRYVRALEDGYKQIWEAWLERGAIETVFARDYPGDIPSYCPPRKSKQQRGKKRGRGRGRGKKRRGKRKRERRRRNSSEL